MFLALGKEFEKRYKKEHLSILKLRDVLDTPPMNIPFNRKFTEPTPAMPDYCKIPNDSLASYRNYYIKEKHFAEWKYSETPKWFLQGKEEEMKSKSETDKDKEEKAAKIYKEKYWRTRKRC